MSKIPKLRFREFSGKYESVKLGRLGSFQGGGTPSTTEEKYWIGNIPWISSSDINENDIKNINVTRYINETSIKESATKLIQKGSILFVSRVGVGKLAIAHTDLCTSQDFTNLTLKNDDNKYISYYFLANKNLLVRYSQGTSIKGFTINDIKTLKLNLPSKQEQEKIASFLTSIDTKVEQVSKKEQLLKQYKKGVMQKIFNYENRKAKENCFSLVDSEPKAMCDSTAGGIRFKSDDGSEFEDWEEKKVSEMFDVTRGNVLAVTKMSEQKTEEFQYPVYSSQTKNKGLTGYFNEYLYEDSITWTTDGANAGDVNFRKGKFYCTNVCGVLKSSKGYANECIAQILNSVTERYVSYVGNPKLMNNTMGTIKIKIPSSIEEQNKIANFLSSIDTKIEQAQKQLEQTKEFKKALLQQMFV